MLTNTERQQIVEEVNAGTYGIDEALDDIAAAQKGEEVRKALYAEALVLNREGHAGSTDMIARQQVANLQTSVNGQISTLRTEVGEDIDDLETALNNGLSAQGARLAAQNATIANVVKNYNLEYGSETLWEATGETGLLASGTTATLSKDVSNFDYIDIYSFCGNSNVLDTVPVDAKLQSSQGYALRWVNLSDPDSGSYKAYVRIIETRLHIIGTTLTIDHQVTYRNGEEVNISGAEITQSNRSTYVGELGIMKVVGRKITANTEIEDVRIGADGTEYASAGQAVRAQVNDLESAIPAIDTTLSVAGAAADAKVAGDKVAELKSDLNVDVNLLNKYEAELYDPSRTTDGYYPSAAGAGAGQLRPNSSAGTTHWMKVKDITKIIVTAQAGGTYNFVFYNENKEYVYGFVQNLSANTPWEYTIPFASYPSICYMRAAFYLTEKSTFSVMGYANCYDVESVSKEIGKSPEVTYDFAEGATPQTWSATSIETFWMTANPEMVALKGQKIKSIRLNIQSSGTTLTVRGYNEDIPMDLTPSDSSNMARQANANGYDIFRITNATAGWSTYLLDGTDDRVEIIDDSLICPATIGLFKAGDTGVFQFYYTSATSTELYFTHKSVDSTQMHESKLGVSVTGEFTNALLLHLMRSNENETSVVITPNDLYELTQLQTSNLKMNCLGDSITYGYIPDSGAQMPQPYPAILKKLLNLSECRNYGISGSTLAVNSGNYQPMCIRYADMDDDADIVLVFGGTNDYGRAVYTPTLGTINDTANTSVYGALNILCDGLITKYPKALIFLCTPLKRADKTGANGGGYTLEDVANAIREVGQKFGMPVLDFNYKGGFYISNATFRAQYGGDDKLHPNQAFDIDHLAPMIARFVESMI